MDMWKKWTALGLVTLLLSAAGLCGSAAAQQRALAARLIRLHVVAASDDAADQARKLRVRDVLLPRITALTADCLDAEAAAARLGAALPELAALAAGTLGTGEPVGASLAREPFPRRDYEGFSLPAGPYRALRIVLGAGRGHNWWCVAFPALCLPAAEDAAGFDEAAAAAGIFDAERALMQPDSPQVRIKFRLLDWLAAVFAP